jgi:hypothetical protein
MLSGRLSAGWTTVCVVALLIVCGSDRESAAQTSTSKLDRLQQQRRTSTKKFHTELGKISAWCAERSLKDAAIAIRRWQVPVNQRTLQTTTLPATVQPVVSLDLPTDERHWQIQLRTHRQKHAHELYLLSRRALKDEPAFSWELIREVAYYDPDHEHARRLLGFERLQDDWLSPFEAFQRKRNQVWHDRFGWLPSTHVARYENGDRYSRGRWYSAERDAALHQDFRKAWEVNTDHYLVKTNVSLEQGVKLAVMLEGFHDYFRSAFPAFFNSPEQLTRAFAGTRKKKRNPYVVHFYRSQQEYVNRLKAKNPQIAITNGIYMPDERVAHFFSADGVDIQSTLYHEATHQVLYELYPVARRIADHEHFWIIEGFACYMESFRKTKDGITIGDPTYVRFDAAQYRLVEDNYYVPLATFAALGKRPFQTHRKIAMNYSQASGLTHFFLHYQNGQYRNALISHLSALYHPVGAGVRVFGLDQLTNTPATQLDEQYRAYMASLKLQRGVRPGPKPAAEAAE